MHREVTTTVRVKIHSLTERKSRLVEREYSAFQDAVHGDDANLYSATKQQAGKVRSNKNPREDTEQPVVLRNDCITIEHDEDTVLSSWWFKLPIYNPKKERGDSIWVPVHVPEKNTHLLKDEYIRDSELVHRDGEWYIHLVCKRSVAVADEYDDVLAVDMGAKWIAVSTFLSDRDTQFHGAEVRRAREHYKQLRKSIGKAKVRSGAQVIERLGDKESRTVEHELHQVANELVARARERSAVIVFGDMTGLRFDNDKGRYVNDKTHKMPYAKMANILTDKSHLDGRECIPVEEYDASVTCWRCGSRTRIVKCRVGWSVTTVGWKTTLTRMVRRISVNEPSVRTFRVRYRRWGLLWLSPKRRSYSRERTARWNLRTPRKTWAQPSVREAHNVSRGRSHQTSSPSR